MLTIAGRAYEGDNDWISLLVKIMTTREGSWTSSQILEGFEKAARYFDTEKKPESASVTRTAKDCIGELTFEAFAEGAIEFEAFAEEAIEFASNSG